MILQFCKKTLLSKGVLGFMLLVLLVPQQLIAQQQTISGQVVSSMDESPLPGVNVVIKGTSEGTVTDLDGNFTIAATRGDVIIVSYVGFLAEEIIIEDQTQLTVQLVEDITALDEVVVIGYGTQKKKLVTGATSQVKSEDLENRNSTSAMQALQGQTPGVSITSTSGQPGEGMNVSIRGVGTIGNSDPLYIVDGVIADNIDYLNPSDIETIDVLKDAASAAIYGSRGANGVVIVTTKKGTAGKGQITFDAYYGVQNRPKKIDLLGAKDYAMIVNEQHVNSGGSPSDLPFDVNNLPAYTQDGPADTDWLDEMFVDNAVTQNYVLGATGGTEQSVYSLSLSYTGQEGIVGGASVSNYERFTGRFNSESKLYNDKITIGQNFTFSNVKKNGIGVGDLYGNSLKGGFTTSPILPMYNDEGEYFNTNDKTILDQFGNPYWYDQEGSPYASMKFGNQNIDNTQRFIGNLYAEFQLLNNLKFRSSLGINYFSQDKRGFTPIYELSVYSFSRYTKANQNFAKSYSYIWDNILTYNFNRGGHNFVAMLGSSTEQYKGSWINGENTDLIFDGLNYAYLNNATNIDNAARMKLEGAPYDEQKRLSFFVRGQYDFKETYMLNATFRADGSSLFPEKNRWGYFPSVSAGWLITNEAFMAPVTAVMPYLKLRGSWGQNGSTSNTTAFNYLAPISYYGIYYAFGTEEGVSTNGSIPSRLSNEDLKWETSEQLNFGFDSRFFGGKIIMNFDWYKKTTKDWIIKAPIFGTAGTEAPFINGGNVTNTGVELALTYNNKVGDLNYKVSVNGAYNKNNVTEVPTEDGIIHGSTNAIFSNGPEFYRAESGHPIGYFWGLETAGIFQTPGEVAEHVNSEGELIQPDAEPGDVRFVDQNDDGVLDDNDKIELGDPNPDLTYGLSVSLEYKGIDLLVVTNGVWGNQIVQAYRDWGNRYHNYTTDILDRWTEPGSSNTVPRVTNQNINYKYFSDLFIQDGSYFRISNITLGYDLARLVDFENLGQFKIYASAQNLYTFTKYNGMDPEVGFGLDKGVTDSFSSGIDYGFYPRPRTYLVGVKVVF